MAEPIRPILLRTLALIPGWIFLLGGMTLLGMVLLTPSWISNRQLAWQRDLLRVQTERLTQQEERYGEFHEALRAEDPVLLERLAYAQFRFKPVNRQLLDQPPLDPAALALTQEQQRPSLLSASVDGWLRAPLPKIGRDVPRYFSIDSRLTRLADGFSRIGLLVVALASVIFGLSTHPRRRAS